MNGSNHDAMRFALDAGERPAWSIGHPCVVAIIHAAVAIRNRRIKPLAEIRSELDALMRLQKLHSVSIVGGEITLHPELHRNCQRVRRRGLFCRVMLERWWD